MDFDYAPLVLCVLLLPSPELCSRLKICAPLVLKKQIDFLEIYISEMRYKLIFLFPMDLADLRRI